MTTVLTVGLKLTPKLAYAKALTYILGCTVVRDYSEVPFKFQCYPYIGNSLDRVNKGTSHPNQ